MGDVSIQIDDSDVKRKLKKLKNVQNGAPKAMMRALNRTVTGMKTDAGKAVAGNYIVKQKDVKEKLVTEKASMGDLSITLRSTGRPMRMVKFKTKANRRPGKKGGATVFAKVAKGGPGGHTGAFMATMANGVSGAFVRTGNFQTAGKGRYKGQEKEMIRQLHGPGVVQMLDNKITREAVQTKATERFYKELDHQVDYLLK